jgi:hypothetical protein
VSAVPHRQTDTIAGFLCAFSLGLSGLSIVIHPAVLAPVAIVLALVAVRMSDLHRRLAGWSVAAGMVAWMSGMTLAISTGNALW